MTVHRLTIAERIEAFRSTFPANRAAWPWLAREQGRDVMYAVWLIGADYRNRSQFYGSYPPGYLNRVMALFPDVLELGGASNILHVFSGSLPAGEYMRCDLVQPAEENCSVYDLPGRGVWRRLVIADPPYSAEDAKKYGTPMVNRGRATAALAKVTRPGGYLCWLDTCWPMHSKRDWLTVGRILIQRSTQHRARILSIFERAAA